MVIAFPRTNATIDACAGGCFATIIVHYTPVRTSANAYNLTFACSK